MVPPKEKKKAEETEREHAKMQAMKERQRELAEEKENALYLTKSLQR